MCRRNKMPRIGNLELLHKNVPMDPTLLGFSYIKVTWRRYEYVIMNPSSSSGVESKGIDLLEYGILVCNSWGSFKIRFINISTTPIGPNGTLPNSKILTRYSNQSQSYHCYTSLRLTQHFIETYTFSFQREVWSEYYHSD